MSAAPITAFSLSTYAFPRDRPIGDAQVTITMNWVGALHLIDAEGETGLGFFLSLFAPLPAPAALETLFRRDAWPALEGEQPEAAIHRIARPRGGQVRALGVPQLETAIDQALWDLAAKRAGLPLHRYLGAANDIGPAAYFSGLEFPLDDDAVHALYRDAMVRRYGGVKVKLGHADIGRDLARLSLVRDAVGAGPLLMIDANESWTVSETLRRVERFAAAGHDLHWVEDPILRSDIAGLKQLKAALGPVMVNAGEYLDPRGRLGLVEADACDVVNLDGQLSAGLHVAWAAAGRNTLMALGNSTMNIGACLAAALPACAFVEDAQLDTDRILVAPFQVEDGRFVLPTVPGHGLKIDPAAIALS